MNKAKYGTAASEYGYGDLVEFKIVESTVPLFGTIEVIDWRGDERKYYDDSLWSYDIACEDGHMGGPCLYKHIPQSSVARGLGITENGPTRDNHCWWLGHDLVAETQGTPPTRESKRMYRPWGLAPEMLDTKVYRYEAFYENVAGEPDGWRVVRVEVGEYRRRAVTWIDEWPGSPEPGPQPSGAAR